MKTSKRQVPAFKLVGKVCRWQTPHANRTGVGFLVVLHRSPDNPAVAKLTTKDFDARFLVLGTYGVYTFEGTTTLCKLLFTDGSVWWAQYRMNWFRAVPDIVVADSGSVSSKAIADP